MTRLGFLLAAGASLFCSCLSLSGTLEASSRSAYLLTLDYSVRNEFTDLKYLANNQSLMALPLTREEWEDFALPYEGVTFQASTFRREEGRERTVIRAQILLDDPVVLEEILSCDVRLEGENPYSLTLVFDRGFGEPSEEAVAYVNGFCGGENVDFTMTGPGGVSRSGSWSLRELLLEPEAPSLTLEWEE
ncbi:MAG: hypothetical protein PQJ60_03265 [Spirochaetales bacterium]|nr:hypothetical protein [Spirochaetales bacterium]